MILSKSKKLALFLLPFVAVGMVYVINERKVTEIEAVDPLQITYDGNSTPDPVFDVSNMLPGDSIEKTVNVKNDSGESESVVMNGVKTEELKDFAKILDIEIADATLTTYFSGKLKDFFTLPSINLGVFTPGADRDFKIKVSFPSDAGNEYQSAKVVFDLIFRTDAPPIEVPSECKILEGKIVNVIEGTEGNDDIRGTHRNDLILAKGGKDKVDGASGDDCIIGGDGNDKRLDGGQGNDVVVGGDGDDFLDGGAGVDLLLGSVGNDRIDAGSQDDKVYGGEGNDKIEGVSGNDLIYGDGGDDKIEGGSGDDEIYGGSGKDAIYGDSGNDKLFGEDGDDRIYGNTGNDLLNGGNGTDFLRGDVGTDTCQFGETINSCEL